MMTLMTDLMDLGSSDKDMNRTKDRITSINKNIANQPRGIFWPAVTKSGRKKEKKLIV